MIATSVSKPENHLHDAEARWFAVYTRYKREKLVRDRLQEKGIETYLPLQSHTRRYTRKVREVNLPLISCYIFTHITRKEYVPVLETPDVVKFVQFSRNLIAIPEAEIAVIKRVVGEQELDIEVCPSEFRIGDPVEIIGGKLTGLKGKLVKQENKKNFVIELQSIGYQLRMQVDPALLQKVAQASCLGK